MISSQKSPLWANFDAQVMETNLANVLLPAETPAETLSEKLV